MTSKATAAHQMKVGIFIAIGFIFILVSLFMVGGDHLIRRYAVLHAYFDHIQGLNEGSTVSLSGVRVGNIEKFIFLPDKNKLDVWIKVDTDFLPRVTEGSTVEIRTQGALGDKFIFITPGSVGGKALADGDVIPVAEASDIMGVLGERGGEAAKIFDVINEVRQITHSFNQDNRLNNILQNFVEVSENLKESSREAKSLVAQMKEDKTSSKVTASVDRMEHILSKIDRGQGTLGALINDSSLHDSLKALLGGQDRKKSVKSLIRSAIDKSQDNGN